MMIRRSIRKVWKYVIGPPGKSFILLVFSEILLLYEMIRLLDRIALLTTKDYIKSFVLKIPFSFLLLKL